MSYKEKIKDFVGKGGYVPFEHGFNCKGGTKCSKCVSVSDKEVTYFLQTEKIKSHWKKEIDSLSEDEAKEVYRDLCEYAEYCRTYA